MRFAACLKKDLRLLTGGGIRSLVFLVLPVLLIFIMLFGMRTAAEANELVPPFPISVRDEDNTVMSRMLISRLREVSVFSSVMPAGEKSDEELAGIGCAAVVTIPKDFFYDLYDMNDTNVVIALNEAMPREAAMVRSAFTSLVGILTEEQRVHMAEARLRFGELSEEELEQVYHDYSSAAVEDALGRLDLFALSCVYSGAFDQAKLFFAAGILSMLIMFIPLSMLRSVSEETDEGLSARFFVSGGSLMQSLLSKLVIAFLMAAIPAAALIIILKVGHLGTLIPLLLGGFLLSFAFFMFVSLICGKASTAQLAGNLILLAVLTLGGALYPYTLLPAAIKPISEALIPRILLNAMTRASMGVHSAKVLSPLIPMGAATLVLMLASFRFLKARRRK